MRRRYLVLRIMSEQTFNDWSLMNVIWDAVYQFFGEYGASHVKLTLIEYDAKKKWAILRCSHKALEMVRASIASITEINGTEVAIHVVGVSGTLKSLRKKFLG